MKQLQNKIDINTTSSYKIRDKKKLKNWLEEVAKEEKKEIINLEYTLISDEELLEINKQSLNHNYFTDIITFDLGNGQGLIEGDIYISYDRVIENAKLFHVKRMDEMRRVILHGLLHLIGYNDKTIREIKEMRSKENYYLTKYTENFRD